MGDKDKVKITGDVVKSETPKDQNDKKDEEDNNIRQGVHTEEDV